MGMIPLIAASMNSQEMLLFAILLALLGLGIASLVIFLLPRAESKTGETASPPPATASVQSTAQQPDSPTPKEVEAFKRHVDATYAEAAARLECLFMDCHRCGQKARPIRNTKDRYKCAGCGRNIPGPAFVFSAKDFPSATLPEAFDSHLPPASLDDALAWRARFAVEERLLKQFKVGEQSFEDYWRVQVTDRLNLLLS